MDMSIYKVVERETGKTIWEGRCESVAMALCIAAPFSSSSRMTFFENGIEVEYRR